MPTLLIFDTEDAGHPVEIGRRMRTALLKGSGASSMAYFEYTHSAVGEWEHEHMAPEMVKLLQRSNQQRPPSARAAAAAAAAAADGGRLREVPQLGRPAGGCCTTDRSALICVLLRLVSTAACRLMIFRFHCRLCCVDTLSDIDLLLCRGALLLVPAAR